MNPIPLIVLTTPCCNVEAAFVLDKIRHFETATIDNLEVLDLVLDRLPDNTQFDSGDKTFTLEMVKRMRFERGLDVRPRAVN